MKILITYIILSLAYLNAQSQSPCDPPARGDQKGKQGSGGGDGGGTSGSGLPIFIQTLHATDPNEIEGPLGYAARQWMSIHDKLGYIVRFENDPEFANGPAKKVLVSVPIDPKLDINSLRLGNFGFGNMNFTVPPNSPTYYTRLDLRDSLGLYVDVLAGINITNHEGIWVFESIDPATGAEPTDPSVGFLPVRDTSITRFNDSIPNKGEGFVSYTIQPKTTDHTGDTAAAQAGIIFDQNAPVLTNTWVNTIDALPPVSQMTMAAVVQDSIQLFWTGQDDPGGSGIKDYAIYVSENGNPFVLFKEKIKAQQIGFAAIPGNSYCFFSQARDNTGNKEKLRDSCILKIGGGTVPLSWLYFNGRKEANIIRLNWATGNEQNTDKFWVERSINGRDYTDIGFRIAAGNSSGTRTYNFPDSTGADLPASLLYYRIRQVDIDRRFTHSNIVTIRNTKAQNDPMVQVYPNPFTQQLNIRILAASAISPDDRLELYNNSGIKVYARSLANRQGTSVITIADLPVLVAGVYYLRVYLNGEKEVIKIVKM